MRRHGEESQPGTRMEQRGTWAQRGQVVIMFAMMGLVVYLTTTYTPTQPHSTRWLLAYGATTYVIVILATVLLTVVLRRPMWRDGHFIGLVIGWALLSLLLFPSLFGSIAIAYALAQLLSISLANGELICGLVLWALFAFPLLWLLRRRVEQT